MKEKLLAGNFEWVRKTPIRHRESACGAYFIRRTSFEIDTKGRDGFFAL